MNLLAVETSGTIGSIALLTGRDVRERTIDAPREQTELTLAFVDELMSESRLDLRDLDAVVFGRGPGSFTGLRIAASVTQGLAMAADLPVVAVSSLAGMALAVAREYGDKFVLTCVDARMGEVYWAIYEVGEQGVAAPGGEHLSAPADVMPPSSQHWVLAGDGLVGHGTALGRLSNRASRVCPDARASARDLLPLAAIEIEQGRVVSAESARPVYLRDASAWRRKS